jgi:HK97 family phage major capsid protein
MAKQAELVERQNRVWSRMQEIQRAAEQQDDWTAEQRQNWDAADAELTEVSGDIERLNRAAELEQVDYRQVADARTTEEQPERPAAEQREQEYERTFGQFMRGGLDRLSLDQRDLLMRNFVESRAQNTGTNSAGGYLIPPGYRTVMSEAMKAFGGLLNYANVITTSEGNPLQWPTNDDTSNVGAILAENTAVTAGDVTFGSRTLGAYTYTSNLVLVSLQLLQDSAFDLDTWLPRKLGERIGRIVATHLVSGTGTGQPTGVTTGVTTGSTGTGTTAISYDNLVDLEHSIDPAYRAGGNCRFIFNDATLAVLRKLKDSDGRPLWQPVPVPGMPATINGLPYAIDQGMPSPGASEKSILFGDFKAGLIVRQVLDTQMVRLAERYMDALQVGFFAFSRLDAKPDDPRAVRAFVHAAS